jgi:Fe-S-cluster-containing hydrogenase component 2
MGIDTVLRQVIKCDQCDGDPACVRGCYPGALQFVPASSVNLMKKRDAGVKLSQVMGRSLRIRML